MASLDESRERFDVTTAPTRVLIANEHGLQHAIDYADSGGPLPAHRPRQGFVNARLEVIREIVNRTDVPENRLPWYREELARLENAEKNKPLFDELRRLHWPPDQFVIQTSGAMGIRGLREIDDIDVLVSSALWERLAAKYPVEEARDRIEISPGIEAFRVDKFPPPEMPPAEEQIQQAEIIDDLPFLPLDLVVRWKEIRDEPKDRQDIELIQRWLSDLGTSAE